MSPDELLKVETYLKTKFANEAINLSRKTRTDGSTEMQLGAEFIGVIYRDEDEDDGEVSYAVHMTILQEDLETI